MFRLFKLLLCLQVTLSGATVASSMAVSLRGTYPSNRTPIKVAGRRSAAEWGRFAGSIVAAASTAKTRLPSISKQAGDRLTPSSRKALAAAPQVRGQTVTVQIKGRYCEYTAADVVKVCKAFVKGDIKRKDFVRPAKQAPPTGGWKYPKKVPKSTVERNLKIIDQATGKRKYELLEESGTLPSKEAPMLGLQVDCMLMTVCAMAHRANRPFRKAAIIEIARLLAINQKIVNRRTHKVYTTDTDMTTWFNSFTRRAENNGLPLVEKQAHGMSRVRVNAVTRKSVSDFTARATLQNAFALSRDTFLRSHACVGGRECRGRGKLAPAPAGRVARASSADGCPPSAAPASHARVKNYISDLHSLH